MDSLCHVDYYPAIKKAYTNLNFHNLGFALFNEGCRLVTSNLSEFLVFIKIFAAGFVSFIFTFYESHFSNSVATFSLNGHIVFFSCEYGKQI